MATAKSRFIPIYKGGRLLARLQKTEVKSDSKMGFEASAAGTVITEPANSDTEFTAQLIVVIGDPQIKELMTIQKNHDVVDVNTGVVGTAIIGIEALITNMSLTSEVSDGKSVYDVTLKAVNGEFEFLG